MPFTIDESAALLDTTTIQWLGCSCKVTAVSVATTAQLRANWPAPVAPRGMDGVGDYNSAAYQAQLMADSREMRVLELAAAIDLIVPITWQVNEGASVVARNLRPVALSEVLALPRNELGAASEAWCKMAMKVLGGISADKLKPLEEAYDELGSADVAAGARGN